MASAAGATQQLNSETCNGWSRFFPSNPYGCLRSIPSKLHVFGIEAFYTITNCLPNRISWFYRSTICKSISHTKLEATVEKTTKIATLHLHAPISTTPNQHTYAVLWLHGDHSDATTMLDLVDISQKENIGSVFTLDMPTEVDHTELSRTLIRNSINKIEEMIKAKGGSLEGLIIGGHSKGGIQAAHHGFVEKDPRIKGVISIAGRLKVLDSPEKACRKPLENTVRAIDQAISDNPEIPLLQIAGKRDWCTLLDAMIVRKDPLAFIDEHASHINILGSKITQTEVPKFLKRFAATSN